MTITVTKQGKIPDKQTYIGRCHNCKTEIKCAKEDGVPLEADENDQRSIGLIEVVCPTCSGVIVCSKRI